MITDTYPYHLRFNSGMYQAAKPAIIQADGRDAFHHQCGVPEVQTACARRLSDANGAILKHASRLLR